MTREVKELSSGKGHRDENFPVASFLIRPRHRAIILAFYRFARAADDVADHPTACPEEKLALLENMRRTILGEADAAPEAAALRSMIAARELGPQHAVDLIAAFSLDVTKRRYRDWDDLMSYCRLSAMPVGRFVLDVHGEAHATWPASDALCAALQVINHLQDCAKDYRNLDRVYIPEDAFAAAGIDADSLAAPCASRALLGVIAELSRAAQGLLAHSRVFAEQIQDRRLAFEVSIIQTIAEDLCRRLAKSDPLSQRVHHRRIDVIPLALAGTVRFARSRLKRRTSGAPIGGERLSR